MFCEREAALKNETVLCCALLSVCVWGDRKYGQMWTDKKECGEIKYDSIKLYWERRKGCLQNYTRTLYCYNILNNNKWYTFVSNRSQMSS